MVSCYALVILSGAVIGLVHALDTIYMDSPVYCNKPNPIPVAEESRVVEPRGTGISNPMTNCVIIFESSYQESSYRFEIVVESAQFRDCALALKIFDGRNVGGNYIRQLGCGSSSSTAQFYSKDRSITLQLTRTQTTYVFGSHFRLRIKTYKAADAGEEYLGTYRFSAGAIIGIVLGLAVIIALAILLGWCYKTGRLSGYSTDQYPPNYKNDKLNSEARSEKSGTDMPGFVSWNMRDADKESATSVSRSNFDLDNPDMWASLTGPPGSKNKEKQEKSRNLGSGSAGGRGYSNGNSESNYYNAEVKNGRYDKNSANSRYYENFDRNNANQLSHSPNSRIKRATDTAASNAQKETTFDKGELGLRGTGRGARNTENSANQKSNNDTLKKRTGSGLFENPDSEGYLYDYEQVQALSDENPEKGKKKTQDFETELKAAISRNSLKRQQSGSQSSAPGGPGSSEAELNKINFSDENVSIPRYDADSSGFSSSNPALGKGEDTGPDAESSPKPKKKKRRSSKERKSPKSKRKGAQDDDAENKSPKSKRKADETEPPEVYAPIFTEDEPSDPASVPNMYQPGYQGNYPPVPYYGDPNYPAGGYPGYPPGMPGMPPMGPYQQAGQAQWYVQGGPDGQKMAFAMTTHSHSSDDALGHPGMPNSSSTPYYQNQYGAPQRYDRYPNAEGPGGPGNALVPAGTVLDDPQVPPPGTSLVRYDDDPTTGIKTSQVIWTDSKPDPTDPPPGSNPQVTRKTITRVTTKATTDELPDAPNPSLHDMSYRTAQQIQASRGEPAFMSPSRGAPALQYPTNSIQYASETPERTNASFYSAPHGNRNIPGAPGPVIHEAPDRNQAIRDRITMSTAED